LKRALVIAYFFPPDASVGTLRTVQYVKYLEQFGWECVVVSADPQCEPLEPKDESLLAQLPKSAVVIRTYAWTPLAMLKRRRKPAVATGEAGVPGKRSFVKRVARFLLSCLMFPDRYSGWYPFALVRGLGAMRKYKIDVI